MSYDLVVAVYKEELSWLKQRNYPDETIYAYRKFERFDYDFEDNLPNIGRESHTFIYHFLKYYNNFTSDYLMLLQGNPHYHLPKEFDNPATKIFYKKSEATCLHYPLGKLRVCNSLGRPFSHWDCELYTFWHELFGVEMPIEFVAIFGAQQIVHKDLITLRSKKFWEKALALHTQEAHAPWAFEILWSYIFDPRIKGII